MKRLFYFFALVIIFSSCQDSLYLPVTTENYITVVDLDTIHHVRLLAPSSDVKMYPDRIYHYFYGGTLGYAESGYLGKVLHGPYVSFTRQKVMVMQGAFDKGLKDGTWKKWYPNGNLYEVFVWNDGRLAGPYKAYYPNSILKVWGEYQNGLRDGDWTTYYENGNRQSVYKYKDGLRNGAFSEYFPDGRLKISGKYKDDELHGKYETYDLSGEKERIRYKNGELLEDKKKEKEEVQEAPKEGEKKKWFNFFKKKDKETEVVGQEEYQIQQGEMEPKEKKFKWWPFRKKESGEPLNYQEAQPEKKEKKKRRKKKEENSENWNN